MSSPDQENFYSSFSGIVEKIEKVKIGRPNRHAKTDYDVVMYIRTKGRRVKILHVEPYVNEGDEIKEGEKIGVLLETPYTGGDFKHAHIEDVSLRFPKISVI